jgi:hypothetical protein
MPQKSTTGQSLASGNVPRKGS